MSYKNAIHINPHNIFDIPKNHISTPKTNFHLCPSLVKGKFIIPDSQSCNKIKKYSNYSKYDLSCDLKVGKVPKLMTFQNIVCIYNCSLA